jgi:hypothetical protein
VAPADLSVPAALPANRSVVPTRSAGRPPPTASLSAARIDLSLLAGSTPPPAREKPVPVAGEPVPAAGEPFAPVPPAEPPSGTAAGLAPETATAPTDEPECRYKATPVPSRTNPGTSHHQNAARALLRRRGATSRCIFSQTDSDGTNSRSCIFCCTAFSNFGSCIARFIFVSG